MTEEQRHDANGGLGTRFWIVAVASGVSRLGTHVLRLAVPWVFLQNEGSPLLAMLSLGIQAAPYLIAPLLSGIIDRRDRRTVYISTELLQALTVATIPAALATDSRLLVFALLTVAGTGEVLSYLTTDYGIIPAIVNPERLQRANSRYFMLIHGGTIGGPVVAGGLIALAGVEAAIYLDAATFLFTAGAGLVLPSIVAPSEAKLRGLLPILSWVRERRDILRLTVALTVYNLGAGSVFALIIATAEDRWAWSSQQVGVALSVGAVAGAFGALAAGRAMREQPLEHRILRWLLFANVGGLVMLLGAAVPVAVIVGYCLTVFGVGGMNVVSQTFRQIAVPSDIAGRVNALIRTVVLGSIPLSALVVSGAVLVPSTALRFLPAVLGGVGAAVLWAPIASVARASGARAEAP